MGRKLSNDDLAKMIREDEGKKALEQKEELAEKQDQLRQECINNVLNSFDSLWQDVSKHTSKENFIRFLITGEKQE